MTAQMVSDNYMSRIRMQRITRKDKRMSELTQCNYCSLLEVKARAKHENKSVTLIAGSRHSVGLPNGIDVYVHPRGLNVRGMSRSARQKYWNRWFMELSDHCVC